MNSRKCCSFTLINLSLIYILISCTPPNSSVEVFNYPLAPPNIKVMDGFQYVTVFLDDSSRYDVDKVHNVGFELWFSNNDTILGNMRIYISLPFDTITFDDNFVRNNLIPVYNGASISAGDKSFVPWVNSMSRVTNHRKFFSHIIDERFILYFVPEPPDAAIILDSANLIITATAGDRLYYR